MTLFTHETSSSAYRSSDVWIAKGGGEEGGSSAPADVAGGDDVEGEVEGGGDQDEAVADVFEEAADAAKDAAAAAAAAAADGVESASASVSGSGGGSGGGGFFKPLFQKRAKTGNKLCSWSWKEGRCEPAGLCQYKYQASSIFFLGLAVSSLVWLCCCERSSDRLSLPRFVALPCVRACCFV